MCVYIFLLVLQISFSSGPSLCESLLFGNFIMESARKKYVCSTINHMRKNIAFVRAEVAVALKWHPLFVCSSQRRSNETPIAWIVHLKWVVRSSLATVESVTSTIPGWSSIKRRDLLKHVHVWWYVLLPFRIVSVVYNCLVSVLV